MIRVILGDRHNIIREGVRSLIEREDDITVVAEAEQGPEVIKHCSLNMPDVLVIDIDMPELNGTEIVRWYTANHPEVKTLGLSFQTDIRVISEFLYEGASGYILEDCDSKELIEAIRTVYSGRKYISPSIVDLVVKHCICNNGDLESPEYTALTNRQREVLQLIAEGRNTKEVADHLSLSIDTVETFRRQIMQKLDIYNISDLTRYAIREGLTFLDI